jgi:hypothetical protein
MDDIVENTGLNSSDVPATLFDLERKGSSGSSRASSWARCFTSLEPLLAGLNLAGILR